MVSNYELNFTTKVTLRRGYNKPFNHFHRVIKPLSERCAGPIHYDPR